MFRINPLRQILMVFVLMQLSHQSWAQTNLICNSSFEDFDQEVFDKMNLGEGFYASHFKHFSNEYEGLFPCWYWGPGEQDMGTTLNNATGLTLGIIPGLFPTTNYVPDMWEPSNYIPGLYSIEPDYSMDTSCLYYTPAEGDSRINLTPSPQDPNLFGMDLSPPNTKFGEGVNAHDGSNYVALFDFENSDHAKPYIFTELKYPLVKDVEYTFSMFFAKMNLLGTIQTEDFWDAVRDGNIRVFVCDNDFDHKQKIFDQEITSHDWNYNEGQVNFIAHHNSNRLYIEYDPFHEQLLEFNYVEKISGVFIDNIKLYEACSTPENMCDNANYRRDLLDVKLEEVEVESPLAFPDDEGFNDGVFKTIRALHLENVKRFEVKIYPHNSSTACQEIDLWYPHSDWFWDGTDYNGDPMPDGHYDAVINAVSNDCFHITDADEKNNFWLKRDYSVFNVWASTNVDDGNTFINGLENVHDIWVSLYSLTGDLIYEFSLDNPPSSLGLSIPSIEEYTDFGNITLAPGYYNIGVKVANNCTETEYTFTNASIQGLSDSGVSPFYDWSPVPKPSAFSCPFNFHYNDNYLTPMNCCEGNLYLHDVEIWNDWDVQIIDTIFAGPNVVFVDGVTNTLIAGEQIVLLPDETGVVINSETILTVGNLNCEICKNYTIVDPHGDGDGDDTTGREIVQMQMDSIMKAEPKEMVLYPNPVSSGQDIVLIAGTEPINPNTYQLAMVNAQGVYIPLKVFAASERMIRFRPTALLSSGAYYLHYECNGVTKTFNVVVR